MGTSRFWLTIGGYRCAAPVFKGWVLESRQEPGHFLGAQGFDWKASSFKLSRTEAVRDALVFYTRGHARKIKTPDEVVRRVELFENRKPKCIISGR